MSGKLEEIGIFLSKLDMKPDRVPTYAEYKKKYREKLFLHPDKAGSDSEELFKEITEAAKKVHDWITDNPELQKTNTDEYKRVAKCFDRANKVEYNKSSVVIHLDDDQCAGWLEALSRRFGASIPLEDQVGVQFKTSHLKIPKVAESFGSFSASVWQNTKKGAPKILLQGKSYMTFITFILPEILKEVDAKNDILKPAIEASAGGFDDIRNETDSNVVAGSEAGTLMVGFQKMESEIIKLRDNLVGIVDESLNQIKDSNSVNMKKFEQKIDKLEKIVLENKSELENLTSKIDEVIAHQQGLKPVDVEALEEFIENSKTTFTKLDDISTIHADTGAATATQENTMNEVLKGSKNLAAKIDDVNRAAVEIKDNINSESKDIKKVVDTISENVSSLVEHLKENKADREPSVRPKEQKNKENEKDKDDKPEVEILEPKKRKGIFFSSSIGLQCDIQKLSNDINSKICI